MPVHARELANFEECRKSPNDCIFRLLEALKSGLCVETPKGPLWCYVVLPPISAVPVVSDKAIGVLFPLPDEKHVGFFVAVDNDIGVKVSLDYGTGKN